MKKRCSFALIVLITLCISSCAPKINSVVPLNAVNNDQIRNTTVGISILTPNREIELAESIYKVLAWVLEESFFSFDGMWNPTPMLEQECIKTLKEGFGMKTELLVSKIPSNIYENYLEYSHEMFTENRKRYKGYGFISGYFNEYTNNNGYLTTLPDMNMLKAAEGANLDYIMEITLTGVSIYHQGLYQVSNCIMYAHARLISVPDGNIVWADKGSGVSKVKGEISPNNPEEFNSYFETPLTNLFNPNEPKGMQIVQNSYIFKQLNNDITEL